MTLPIDAALRANSSLIWPDRETLRREFLEFVHRVDDLHLAVDQLVFCARARNPIELVRHGRNCGADHMRTLAVLDFLTRQGFLIKADGRQEAIPDAIDEFVHRIERDGVASPAKPPIDPDPAARRVAMEKVSAALAAAGYRDKATRRLRVVQ